MDLREHAKKGPRLSFYNSEFVVALKHLGQVKETLTDCGVPPADVELSPDLDLALVKLADDKSAAARINATLQDALRVLNRPDLQPDPRTVHSDLDRFMFGLRELFATRYAGWSPTIGKNRLVGDVGGVGKISHGGDDNPTPTDQRFPDRSERDDADLGMGVRVGVLDTSISSHQWLAGGWVSPPGGVLAERKEQAKPAGHATFVAGLVLSQAPACVIEGRSVLSDDFGQATSWDTAKAIAQIGKTRPDVLNLSFTCYTEDGQAPLALATAIDRLDSSTVVVAATGNHGNLKLEDEDEWREDDRRKPAWPAALDGVVAIGAATAAGAPARFTPPNVQWVDAIAEGERVVSTFVTASVNLADLDKPRESKDTRTFHGWASWSGTSFSAALVSGVIAAKTVPGKVSSRQAWDEILEQARKGEPPVPLVRLLWPVPTEPEEPESRPT
jgi:membrane-anchored mycosin MYCP